MSRGLADLVKLTDALEYIQAQSTALVVSDAPEGIVDRYRLYIVLKNSPKAIITGTFSIDALYDMKRMLEVVAGGVYLAEKHTLEWFRKEQYIPSELVDRQESNAWKAAGSKDVVKRAREIVKNTLKEHKPKPLPSDVEKDLDNVMKDIMKRHKISTLPYLRAS